MAHFVFKSLRTWKWYTTQECCMQKLSWNIYWNITFLIHVFLICGYTHCHSITNPGETKIRIDLHYMLVMLDIYLPSTTTVIFVANTRECSDLKPPEVEMGAFVSWAKCYMNCCGRRQDTQITYMDSWMLTRSRVKLSALGTWLLVTRLANGI
jgi:hypothetical protein